MKHLFLLLVAFLLACSGDDNTVVIDEETYLQEALDAIETYADEDMPADELYVPLDTPVPVDLTQNDADSIDFESEVTDISDRDLTEQTEEAAQGCGGGPPCGPDEECCFTMSGTMTCVPKGQCMFGCGNGCGPGMVCCDFFGSGIKICMPEAMCPGSPGGCTKDEDCKPGQVCCKFGDMAAQPMCMAEGMCPKECKTNEDCPPTQECCDLKDHVICVDKGQCPQRCYHSTMECPLGQECCDAGDELLVCVADAECPGSVPCDGPGAVCLNSEGKPKEGFVCCDVPEVGYRCVGSQGCGNWQSCSVMEDCPVGRECCPLQQGRTCVPTGACPVKPEYKGCDKHIDCVHTGQICCYVPGLGSVCADKANCPSECLTDSDCGSNHKCCIQANNPATCIPPEQCGLMQPCDPNGNCGPGQECCEVMGQMLCMPKGQCVASSCKTDADCNGQKCCNFGGQMVCLPQCF